MTHIAGRLEGSSLDQYQNLGSRRTPPMARLPNGSYIAVRVRSPLEIVAS